MKSSYLSANKTNNDSGTIALSTQVFEQIAQAVLEDDNNIKLSTGYFKKAIICSVLNNAINIDIDILLKHSNNVNELCSKKMKEIIESIKNMTDFQSVKINISVRGFFI